MDKEKLAQVLIVILLIVLVIFLFWFMFGHSPTLEQVVALFVIPLYVFTFGMYERLNNKIMRTNQNLSEKIHQTRENFQKELGEIKQTLGKIEGKL